MKFRKIYLWILAAVFLLSSSFSFWYWKDFEPRNTVRVFVTVGIDQTQRPAENSSYELQRAAEHFSDVILGWTLEPSFRADFLETAGAWHTLTGQRQEKQNLLFEITNVNENLSSEDLSSGEALITVLQNQLDEYNAATHQGYVLAVSNVSFEMGVHSFMPMFGEILLALVITATLLIAYEYATSRRRS